MCKPCFEFHIIKEEIYPNVFENDEVDTEDTDSIPDLESRSESEEEELIQQVDLPILRRWIRIQLDSPRRYFSYIALVQGLARLRTADMI